MRKCKPQDIINMVSDAQTVVLPNDWFDGLEGNKSVFQSLYDWMVDSNRVPNKDRSSLHTRTYVGKNMYEKLHASEKKRIKKLRKLKGEDLTKAVGLSDLNSGPMTTVGGLEISGDVIIVIPESGCKSLGELSRQIEKNERNIEIKKASSQGSGATFRQWLLSQIKRDDHIADLARLIENDKQFPLDVDQYEKAERFLRHSQACEDAIDSLKEAWINYFQQYPDRVRPSAWCNDCGNQIDIAAAHVAWSPDSLEDFVVLDSDCLYKSDDVEPSTMLILSSVTEAKLESIAESNGLSREAPAQLAEKLRLWGVFPANSDEGWVYFIRSGGDGNIKIGYTSGSAQERLKGLQTAQAHPLHILATVRGNRNYEHTLHQQFSEYRLEGEWFSPHPDLIGFISVLNSKTE